MQAAEHDVSAPLWLMAPAKALPATEHAPIQGPHHLRQRGGALWEDPVRNRPAPAPAPAPLPTPAPLFSMPGVGQNFLNQDGSTLNDQVAPPDTNGDIGPSHYISIVNLNFAVFDKNTGSLLYGSVPTNTLFAGFAGAQGLCGTTNDGDIVVLYDPLADRWLISQFAFAEIAGLFGAQPVPPFYQCVAVSASGDPLGQWNRYAFGPYQSPTAGPDGGFIYDAGGTQTNLDAFNDYPKLGVWSDAYLATFNLFGSNVDGTISTFASKVCAFDKTSMLAGADATQQCFQLSQSYGPAGDQFYGDVLPVDFDGTLAPPDGAPGLFINYMTGADGGSYVGLWRFHADFTNPANSTLNGGSSYPYDPVYVSGVAPFIEAVCTATSQGRPTDCILEPDVLSAGFNQLDSLGDRMMFRASYRRFTADGGYESILANHTVFTSSATTANTGVRWYEIRSPYSNAPAVFQQQTFSPDDSVFRWMAGIAQDKFGNIALGYSATSPDAGSPDGGPFYPSVFYAAHGVNDTLGTMRQEQVLTWGAGSQEDATLGGDLDRWGDYSDMVVDPVDDCTFWYTQELIPYTSDFNWTTTIGAFRFPECVPVARYVLSGASSATTGAPVSVTATVVDRGGATVTSYSGSATLSATDGGIAPAQVTVTNGVGTASVTFTEAGALTLSATDNANALLRGSTAVTVAVAGPKGYAVNGLPATLEAGQVVTVTAAAVDAYGNVATTYAGTGAARVTSSDARAAFPATLSFANGVSQPFQVSFAASGTQTLTLTDAKTASITSSIQVAVVTGAVSKYAFSGLGASVKSGQAQSLTLSAVDAFGNTVTTYAGTAQVTSSDAKAVLPANPSFMQGVASGVSVTFKTTGAQTLTASDTSGIALSGTVTTIVTQSGCGCGVDGAGVDAAGVLGLLAFLRAFARRRRSAA